MIAKGYFILIRKANVEFGLYKSVIIVHLAVEVVLVELVIIYKLEEMVPSRRLYEGKPSAVIEAVVILEEILVQGIYPGGAGIKTVKRVVKAIGVIVSCCKGEVGGKIAPSFAKPLAVEQIGVDIEVLTVGSIVANAFIGKPLEAVQALGSAF